ncbi:MAG: NAD(P)/FAD-dependent oxidoreductase [Geminicoccaceae bacterium]
MRIAVVGSGISGLGVAWLLNKKHDVVLYECRSRLGGHTNTVEVDYPDGVQAVDTGFIVYNEANYPNLTALFDHLGIATEESRMSFAVSVDNGRLEYSGRSLRHIFAQKRNLLSPRFAMMLLDIVRFNRDGPACLAHGDVYNPPLGTFLDERRYGSCFQRNYLLPMAAAIWSASLDKIREFPTQSFLRFFANHNLLTVNGHHYWRTVAGGSQRYIDRMLADFQGEIRLKSKVAQLRHGRAGPIVIDRQGHRDQFDRVVLACHADQALAALAEPTVCQRSVLGAFPYQSNRAVLHRDPDLMPKRRSVWSSWNYMSNEQNAIGSGVSVSYWMNSLQNIREDRPLFVSLNPLRDPNPATVLGEYVNDHPVFDHRATAAQARLAEIQGQGGIWFAGAYQGFGFHEDGLASAIRIADAFGIQPPWAKQEITRPIFEPESPTALAQVI